MNFEIPNIQKIDCNHSYFHTTNKRILYDDTWSPEGPCSSFSIIMAYPPFLAGRSPGQGHSQGQSNGGFCYYVHSAQCPYKVMGIMVQTPAPPLSAVGTALSYGLYVVAIVISYCWCALETAMIHYPLCLRPGMQSQLRHLGRHDSSVFSLTTHKRRSRNNSRLLPARALWILRSTAVLRKIQTIAEQSLK